MKRAFTKPATTYSQQVALLQERGMRIDNTDEAKFFLQHLNYYRLSAYWLPFEVNHTSHQFKPETCFSEVLNLYIFDRELRLLVLDSIERIEVSVRSQWAHCIGHEHGAHAHLNADLFKPRYWRTNLERLKQEVERSEEDFIKHLKETYKEDLPPVWAICEVMSLGLLSKWYGSLKPKNTRRAIADIYQVNESVLESWLIHLSTVRNICAHHSRLWNRKFTRTPKLPKGKPSHLHNQFESDSRQIYNTLVILMHLLDVISPSHSWHSRFKRLIAQYAIPTQNMGFPNDWKQRKIWRDS